MKDNIVDKTKEKIEASVTDKAKEKIGDWLLDIAKYILTAVLLTAIFSGITDWKWYWYAIVVFVIALLFVIGIYIINWANKDK